MADDVYILTESDRHELLRLRRKLDRINGPGVRNTPDSVDIRGVLNRPPSPVSISPPTSVLIRLTSATTVVADKVWRYSWELVAPEFTAAYPGYAAVMADGVPAVTQVERGYAWNRFELGGQLASISAGFPSDGTVYFDSVARGNRIVEARFRNNDGTAWIEFDVMNPLIAECAV